MAVRVTTGLVYVSERTQGDLQTAGADEEASHPAAGRSQGVADTARRAPATSAGTAVDFIIYS